MEVRTQTFEAWRHTSVKGVQIDTQGLPFSDTLLDDSFPGVVELVNNDPVNSASSELTRPSTGVPLVRLSPSHGRSYEIATSPQDILGTWQDRHGNSYTSLSIKGANFSDPKIYETATAPSGYLPYGLQEDDALERVLKAGEIMRAAGISTEWVVRLLEPKKLGWKDEGLTQTEYKQRIIADTIRNDGLVEGGKKAAAIRNLSFFVTARAMEINDRLWDIRNDESHEAAKARLDKTFRVYNLTHQGDADFRTLDSESPTDREYYFTTLLPTLCGKTLGNLHRLGLTHKFPHLGNYTMLGGLVDTDSISGPILGLGDPEVTLEAKGEDLAYFLGDSRSYWLTLFGAYGKGLLAELTPETIHMGEGAFLDAYLQASGLPEGSREFIELALWSSRYSGEHFKNAAFGARLTKALDAEGVIHEPWELLKPQPTDMTPFLREARATLIAGLDRIAADMLFVRQAYDEEVSRRATVSLYDEILQDLRQNINQQRAEINHAPDQAALNAVLEGLQLPGQLSSALANFVSMDPTDHEDELTKTQMIEALSHIQSWHSEHRANLSIRRDERLPLGKDKLEVDMLIFKGMVLTAERSVTYDVLLQALEAIPGPVHIELHDIASYINSKEPKYRPQTYFSDASDFEFTVELDKESYELKVTAADDGTYLALLTAPDEEGVTHLFVTHNLTH